MRLLVTAIGLGLNAAICVGLSACGSVERLISTDPEAQQTDRPEDAETCENLKELRIGMTTSQVVSDCERKPLRTSDLITRDGKKITVLSYRKSNLQITDDKLIQIFPLEQN